MSYPTVNLFLDKRATPNELGVVKIVLTFNRIQRLYTTGVKLSLAEFERLQANKGVISGRIKDQEFIQLHRQFYGEIKQADGSVSEGYYRRCISILNTLGQHFTFDKFKDAFDNYGKTSLHNNAPNDDVIKALNDKKELMYANGRIGNGSSFGLAAKSLLRFINSLSREECKEYRIPTDSRKMTELSTLKFESVTSKFLEHYEQWAKSYGKLHRDRNNKPIGEPKGASPTTIGIYLRQLRVLFNDAIADKIISRDSYPFGKNQYIIPAGRNIKKALSKPVIEQLKHYQPTNDLEQQALDFWLFSYFCNGMNFADIARLRWSDFDEKGMTLKFIRTKTIHTKKSDLTPIQVKLRAETLAIIKKYGTHPRKPEAYVFGFLNLTMTAKQSHSTVKQFVKNTNKYMKRIAQTLGIEASLNSYTARHSFATILLRSNAPLKFISDSLGHANISTTENYLASFEPEQEEEFLRAL